MLFSVIEDSVLSSAKIVMVPVAVFDSLALVVVAVTV